MKKTQILSLVLVCISLFLGACASGNKNHVAASRQLPAISGYSKASEPKVVSEKKKEKKTKSQPQYVSRKSIYAADSLGGAIWLQPETEQVPAVVAESKPLPTPKPTVEETEAGILASKTPSQIATAQAVVDAVQPPPEVLPALPEPVKLTQTDDQPPVVVNTPEKKEDLVSASAEFGMILEIPEGDPISNLTFYIEKTDSGQKARIDQFEVEVNGVKVPQTVAQNSDAFEVTFTPALTAGKVTRVKTKISVTDFSKYRDGILVYTEDPFYRICGFKIGFANSSTGLVLDDISPQDQLDLKEKRKAVRSLAQYVKSQPAYYGFENRPVQVEPTNHRHDFSFPLDSPNTPGDVRTDTSFTTAFTFATVANSTVSLPDWKSD